MKIIGLHSIGDNLHHECYASTRRDGWEIVEKKIGGGGIFFCIHQNIPICSKGTLRIVHPPAHVPNLQSKEATVKKFVFLFFASVLIGCGGGGGGGTSATPTPAGTAVSMAIVKGVYYGTAAPGTQMSFPLAGSDSQGISWTGSFTAVSDGPTTFESQNVTKSRSLVTLQRGAGTPISGITSRYYLTSNSTLYKSVSSLGVTTIPISQTVLPDTIHVGDFDTILNASNSDGTTVTSTWQMEAEYNGNTIFVTSGLIKTGATVTSSEQDSYYLDQTGNPYKISIIVTTGGVTITLSGDRI